LSNLLIGFLFAELCVLLLLGLGLGLLFVLIGVWPALITSVGITGITLIRLPWNVCYHCLITYRTVMLRTNVKVLSFLLIPVVQLLIPPFTLIICFVTHMFWFTSVSFIGHPLRPWRKIDVTFRKFWEKYVTGAERRYENYGHTSGIPQDWDGQVIGLPVDPLKIILNIILYVVSVVPISLGVFVIFLIKAVPIFLAALVDFVKVMNIVAAVKWYKKVLAGSQPEPARTNLTRPPTHSGHNAWTGQLKEVTKGTKKSIENYANIKIFEVCGCTIRKHAKLIKHLHPKTLVKIVESYSEEFSPMKLIPEDAGAAWVILWIPLLFSCILWVMGLVLVLSIPPLTFLFGVVAWTLAWIPVIVLPPVLYVTGWILIIVGLPACYLLLWGIALVGPLLFIAVGAVSGPFLALNVLFSGLLENVYNPAMMWSGIKHSLGDIPRILKKVDKVTASLSLGHIRFTKADTEAQNVATKRVQLNYWDLYVRACRVEARKIQTEGWLIEEDIQGASPTALIAIPGVAILSILVDSIKRNRKDKTLIVWDDNTECKDSTRDLKDNVSNVFWPQVMQVKKVLLVLPVEDLDVAAKWVSASLCDGEDEKSELLAATLSECASSISEEHRKWCLKIRASLENIVHSLLRVQTFSSRLNEIVDTLSEEENHMDVLSKEGGPSAADQMIGRAETLV
jgi:hypothetical protein